MFTVICDSEFVSVFTLVDANEVAKGWRLSGHKVVVRRATAVECAQAAHEARADALAARSEMTGSQLPW
jgi:hypothetical protein